MGVESLNCIMASVGRGRKAHSVPSPTHQTRLPRPLPQLLWAKKKTLKYGQKHSNVPYAYAWKKNPRHHALPGIQRKKHLFHLLTSKLQCIKKKLRRKSFGKSKAVMGGEFGWQKRSNLMCLPNLCCQKTRKHILVQTQNACMSTKIPSIPQ